jgi:excisionase family DNA binding protein
MDTDKMVTVDEAAEQLNISVLTAWRWIRSGKLKTVKWLGRRLVSKEDITLLNTESTKPK